MSQDPCTQACDTACTTPNGFCFDSKYGMCQAGCAQSAFATADECNKACPPLTSESMGRLLLYKYSM